MNLKKFFPVLWMFLCIPAVLSAQDDGITLRPTPGEEMILAVADIQPASAYAESELADMIETFDRVLLSDLRFSGFFTLAGKSYYPPQPTAILTEENIPYDAWSALPFPVTFLSSGTIDLRDGMLHAELVIFDMKQHKRMFDQTIDMNMEQVRAIAHQWADEIVYQLSGGVSKGISSTKIAYSSKRGNAAEIYVMDYDGHNPLAFTHNQSLNLHPHWSSDNSKLAFMSYRSGKPEINIYSFIDGIRLQFPAFNTLASTPAISPDGKKIAFSLRTPRGDADLFVSNLDGSDRRNITNNPAIDSTPSWSPSGRQLAFVSSRGGGAGQIYICDADGANIRRLVKEGGDADKPVWSPDGRWLAFHWKYRMSTNYDLFLAEVSTGEISQLTVDSHNDESPSWAPDGQHLAFQSNRTGTNQIYIMTLDGKEVHRITSTGSNTSPSWGGYVSKR